MTPALAARSSAAGSLPLAAPDPRAPVRVRTGGLVVGSDGRPDSIAALRIAALLADRRGEPVHVASALGAVPAFAPGYEPLLPDVGDAAAARQRAVRRLVREAAGDAADWTIGVDEGRPASVLAAAVHEHRARLVLVGLGLRRLRDTQLGGETALRVLRQARVPVLAVSPESVRLPQSAVVAVDFGAASLRAAHTAMALVGDRGTVYLVHVRPPVDELPPPRLASRFLPGEPSALRASGLGYPESLDPWFARLEAELSPPPQVLVRRVVLRGLPTELLLDFTERVRADLVAVGAQGPTAPEPCGVGSVAHALVRTAHGSVLVAPPPAPTPAPAFGAVRG